MLEHGGHLRAAAQKYGIPLENWVDLSTGINPHGWPVRNIPPECWLRLPEDSDDLLSAAQGYYQNSSILPVAGSQAAIQTLPRLRTVSRVGVLNPAYAEHAAGWVRAGHAVVEIDPAQIEAELSQLDVLILINPNNPTGQTFRPEQLLRWHHKLQQRQGWLIIDEAFIECSLENSLSGHPVQEGLIILRSIGKFFGLAGIRCGFVISQAELLNRLKEVLGPWTISHPARFAATGALRDVRWQRQTHALLCREGRRLKQLLSEQGLRPDGGCDLFQWIRHNRAEEIHDLLASRGILCRLFLDSSSLRFGLPQNKKMWLYLEESLSLIR